MDSDPLKHLEFFSVPNNQVRAFQDASTRTQMSSPSGSTADHAQTVNAVDQNFLTRPLRQSATWESNVLGNEAGTAGSPSTAPTSISLDSLIQTAGSSAATNNMVNPSAMSSRTTYGQTGQGQRRAQRTREGHERKRSRLSTSTTPIDSVDSWIQFDEDGGLTGIPESSDPWNLDQRSGKGPATAANLNRSRPMASSPRASVVPAPVKTEDVIDDSALDNALSDDEELFSSINLADHLSKIDTAPPSEIPPREGLYSTPLSWEKPQPGLRMDSLIGLNSPMLNEAEQRRLIAIAMNPGPSMGGLGSNINLSFGGLNSGLNTTLGPGIGSTISMSQVTDMAPHPKPLAQPRPTPLTQQKKQGSINEKSKEKVKPGDRTAHNDIERKYRTNLKDRIAELRGAVPSLQTISENAEDEGEGSQPSRTPKVSKGTVLTKATEYIHYLERRNKQIVQEHRELSRRLQAFEQLLNATARPTFQMPNYSRTLFDPRGFC